MSRRLSKLRAALGARYEADPFGYAPSTVRLARRVAVLDERLRHRDALRAIRGRFRSDGFDAGDEEWG